MSASSQLFATVQQRLSSDSQQLLGSVGLGAAPSTANQTGKLTDDEKLAIFDKILDEAEAQPAQPTPPVDTISDEARLFASVPPQALPQATEQLWQQSQQAQQAVSPGQTGKERAAKPWSIDAAVQESGGLLTAVEQEHQPEISPEVESYLQRVETNQESPAAELAKLIPQVAAASGPAPTEVVRVLPVTKTMAAAGHKKSPKFSIRWLVEWSDKVIKMFQGKAVYRPAESASSQT